MVIKSENVEDVSVTNNDDMAKSASSNNKKYKTKPKKVEEKKPKEEKAVPKRRTARNSVAAKTSQPSKAKYEEDYESNVDDVNNSGGLSDPGKKIKIFLKLKRGNTASEVLNFVQFLLTKSALKAEMFIIGNGYPLNWMHFST